MKALLLLSPLLLLPACAQKAADKGASQRALVSFAAAPDQPAVPADAPPLNQDQLRACLTDRQQVQQGKTETEAARDALFKRQDDLKAQEATLDQQKPSSGSGHATIVSYNAKVKALNTQFQTLHDDNERNNARVQQVNGVAQKFQADCAGHKFYQDDLDGMKKDYPDLKL